MTFPTIPTVADGRVAGLNQLNTVTILSSVNLNTLTKAPGDLLIAIAGEYQSNAGADAAFTGWAGGGLTWTEIRDSTGTTVNRLGVAIARVVTGSETGTVTVTRSGTLVGDASMILLVIPGAHDTTNPEATPMASATNPADPASLSPSWGAEDTLWIGVNGNGMTSGTGSWTANNSAPTNYGDFFGTNPADTSTIGDFGLAVAFRQLNAAAEDMGGFGQDTSNARSSALVIAVRPAAGAVTGTVAVVLPALAADASGSVDVEGSATVVLPALDASLAGTVEVSGVTGIVNAVLPALASSSAGLIDAEGTATVTLPALTASTAGVVEVAGTVAATLPALGASASGTVEVSGSASVTLPALDASLTGTVEISGVSGTVAVVLPALAATAAGSLEVEGTTTITLPALEAAASGSVEVSATADVVLPALGAVIAGTVIIPGQQVPAQSAASVTSRRTSLSLIGALRTSLAFAAARVISTPTAATRAISIPAVTARATSIPTVTD